MGVFVPGLRRFARPDKGFARRLQCGQNTGGDLTGHTRKNHATITETRIHTRDTYNKLAEEFLCKQEAV
jgi:hypothetical protein